ncbi:MAG: class I tRNA ligase family protein [Lentisphaeria bacterium]|nr:class I tRNA ligase family protein [Lentisphaeria bacterium]
MVYRRLCQLYTEKKLKNFLSRFICPVSFICGAIFAAPEKLFLSVKNSSIPGTQKKQTALWYVLTTFAKLTAPYTPFIAEQMYLNLVPAFFKDAPESVHLCAFPEYDGSMVDKQLENGMDTVLDIVNLGRAARNTGNVKNRQPLSEMYVVTARAGDLGEGLKAIALDELNIKEYKSAEFRWWYCCRSR